MREKKNKLVKTIASQIEAGEISSEEHTKDIAEKWMEIADVDGNGTIDIKEFLDFVSKLDETQTEDATKEIFD